MLYEIIRILDADKEDDSLRYESNQLQNVHHDNVINTSEFFKRNQFNEIQ